MIQRVYLSAALIFYFAITSSAQSRYRVEVFGSGGVSDYLVIFGPPVKAVNVGGGIGLRPFSGDRSALLRMLGVEFEANASRKYGVTQTYFTGNLVLHASFGKVEPYLLLGIGGSHEQDTHRAGDAGIGTKIFITPRISVRPELRAFFTEYLGSFARESVAISYHW